jgi:hypothetical protein
VKVRDTAASFPVSNIQLGRDLGAASMAEDDLKDDPDYAEFVTPTFELYEDDEAPASKILDIDNIEDKHDFDTYDQHAGVQVRVSIGDDIRTGKVVWRNREIDGTVKGEADANSMLDTRT